VQEPWLLELKMMNILMRLKQGTWICVQAAVGPIFVWVPCLTRLVGDADC
jgi:hypothetical protein